MASNIPGPPTGAAAPAAPPKKGNALKFVLIGCGSLLVLMMIGFVLFGLFVAHKAKQYGLDPDLMKRNPAFAAAKMLTAANPDFEVLESDEGKGIITVRNKKDGKRLTIDVAQTSKKHQIVFRGENGEEVTFGEGAAGEGNMVVRTKEGTTTIGAGAKAKLPAWMPSYPGVTTQSNFSMQGDKENTGSYGFTTKDSPEQIASFYEQGFKSAGLSVTKTTMPAGAMLMVEDAEKKRSGMVNVVSEKGQTQVTVTFQTKN